MRKLLQWHRRYIGTSERFRRLVTAAVLWTVVTLMVIFLQPFGWFSSVLSGPLGLVIGFLLIQALIETERSPLAMSKSPSWCPDCGSQAIVWRAQRGFNMQTGQPLYMSRMGCPDWESALLAKMPSGYRLFDDDGVMGCGSTKRSDWEPAVKHNHELGEVEVNCIRCLMDMERAGIITKGEAQKQIKQLS